MTSSLRDTARLRWEETNERNRRADVVRRFVVAFLFGLGISTLVALIIQTAVQRAASPITDPIREGLRHE
jgi:hypothetical protein